MTHEYKGLWGDWKSYKKCDSGYYVTAFTTRVDKIGAGWIGVLKDNTAMNAIW